MFLRIIKFNVEVFNYKNLYYLFLIILFSFLFKSNSAFSAAAIAFDKTDKIYYSCTRTTLQDAKKCAVEFCFEKSGRQCEAVSESIDSKGWNALVITQNKRIISWGKNAESLAKNDALKMCINENPDARCFVELTFQDKSHLKDQDKEIPKKPQEVAPKKEPIPANISQGTGFVINQDGYIVTNSHVVANYNQCSYLPENQSRATAKIVRRDREMDLALLKADRSFKKFARLSNKDSGKGQEVLAIGYPIQSYLASQQILTSGLISATAGLDNNSVHVQHTASIQPGNSGGPLFNYSGSIVGVNVSTINYKKLLTEKNILVQNINFAIKSSSLKQFLDSAGVKYSTSISGSVLKPEVIAKDSEDFILKIECQ